MISDGLAQLVSLVMRIPVGFEWLILVLVIIVLFFGIKKIPELARSLGKARTEYEKSRIEAKKELQSIKSDYKSSGGSNTDDRKRLEEIAETLGIEHATKNSEELRAAIEAEIAKGKDA